MVVQVETQARDFKGWFRGANRRGVRIYIYSVVASIDRVYARDHVTAFGGVY